jgi:hypothetical protein
MTHELGFDSQQKQKIFLLTTTCIPASGAHSAFHPVVMRIVSLGFEDDHFPPPNAEVKHA